jgi:hypothetical protein
MSLTEKSAQTISGEIQYLKSTIEKNENRIEILKEMIREMQNSNNNLRFDIREMESQLELRAKQKI